MASDSHIPDLVIRGGTIVDGTGNASFIGDVAIKGDIICEVAPTIATRGLREYDARGLVVSPGWIDCHTHFDAQVTWDPYLSPSTANGVTTCIMGMCGIGFAPCQPDRRAFLAHLIEAVEDLPGPVITDGMVWDWETFEEYLDSVGRRSYACDVAVLVGHAAVRTWVLGKRASASDKPNSCEADLVKPEEIEAMAQIVEDAVAAGALGFSTSRGLFHRDKSGFLTPGTLAGKNELLPIACAIAKAGGGIFQWATDWASYVDLPYAKLDPDMVAKYQDDEMRWMTQIAREHGSKVALTWTLGWGVDSSQASWDSVNMQIRFLEDIKKEGGFAKAQVFVRPQGFLFSFDARVHPFLTAPAFVALQERCRKEGLNLISELKDESLKMQIIREAEEGRGNPAWAELYNIAASWDITYKWTEHYEPGKNDSIAAMAESTGKNPFEVAYDMLVNEGMLWRPFATWGTRDMSPQHKLFNHPQVVPGGDDAGAHHTIFMDATSPSHMVTHWVRGRTKGPRLALEHAVKKSTWEIAELFGLRDRGTLRPGMKADLNVFDLDKLRICRPYFREDLPLGAGRWLQAVDGYKLTVVAGRETWRDGMATGVLPGGLVRNPNRKADQWRGIARSLAGPFDSEALSPEKQAAAAEAQRRRALEGAGSLGTSAAARVLRDSVEVDSKL